MESSYWENSQLHRIIQESVPGRQITLAHIIAKPREILYRKLGLNPDIDYHGASIGLLTMSPGEMAIIGADLATKSSTVDLGFVDRFSGSLIITGSYSNVSTTLKAILDYAEHSLNMAICPITKT